MEPSDRKGGRNEKSDLVLSAEVPPMASAICRVVFAGEAGPVSDVNSGQLLDLTLTLHC